MKSHKNQKVESTPARPRLARKLTVAHLAFYRGAVEGLDLSKLGERYLDTGADRVRAKATLRWIRDELVAAARNQRPQLVRLLRLSARELASPAAADVPSLEEFQATHDPDGFYSEAELIELFQTKFPQDPRVQRNARLRARLRQRLFAALTWLESVVPSEPHPGEPLVVWLDPAIAGRLSTAGLYTLRDLVDLIRRRGTYWFRKVPGMGRKGAERLERWLAFHGLLETEIATSVVETGPQFPSPTRLLPLERLTLPADWSGRDGANRAHGGALSANDDLAAVRVWLSSLGQRAHTVRSYQAQAERFLLWMLLERGKPLSSASTEDCISYRDWLNALGRPEQMWFWQLPGSLWIGPRAAPRGSPEWRPFTGPLAPSSQKLAVTILTAMCEWLMRQRYLATNPWDGVPPSHNLDGRLRTDRSLTPSQWQATIAACDEIQHREARLRLRAALFMAYALGLRRAELAAMVVAKPAEKTGELNHGLKPSIDGTGWDLEVLGKRQKMRRLPVPDAALAALADYLEVRKFGNDPSAWPAGLPLLATLPAPDHEPMALSDSALYRMLCAHFQRAAKHLRAREAAHLGRASTHWLRHTHATHALAAGGDIDAVQENLGHSSAATTAIYSHASRTRRKAAMEALMKFATPA